MDNLSKIFSHLIEPPLFYFVVGGLVVLILLYLIYKVRLSTRGIIPFKSQGGTIEISPSTLRGVIQHAANSVEGVEKASCHHFIKGRSIGVRIAVHLRANNRLKDVESRIKRYVRATLYEQFGMENIDPIHIRITRIVGDPVAVGENRYPDELDESQAALLETDRDSYDDRPFADETRP
ncbi:MAG TPA: hypothetical protein VK995_06635 [Oceanipulchritudo sp.]|nr:hypothetical protein [Oceanipulchritudo sp.]